MLTALINKILFPALNTPEFKKMRQRHESAFERNLVLLKKVNGDATKTDNEKEGNSDDPEKAEAVREKSEGGWYV